MAYFLNAEDSVALVVDEYGALVGLVTVEDASEEIVGDIIDEYDPEHNDITDLGNGRYLLSGSIPCREFGERFDFELSGEKATTIAGFILERLGHLPLEGESVEDEPFRFTVARVRAKRIRTIYVERIAEGDGEKQDD